MKKPIFLISVLTMMLTGFSQARARQFEAPAMGWSSWNAYMVDISDSIISNQARMLKESGLSDCGYKYVNIDDGFFGKRDAKGYMTPHPERFPWGVDGMANLVKYIHSLGLKAGIYSDAGTNTCGSSYNHDVNGKGAGMYGHDVVDATRYFIDWDFDFIKIDYCGGQELKLDEQARYTAIRNVIDSIARKKLLYLSMSDAERKAYERNIDIIVSQNDALATTRAEGRDEGRAEGIEIGKEIGRAEGERMKSVAIARKLKDMGMDAATIQATTELSAEDIDNL